MVTKGRTTKPKLARPGDPLVLADGSKIKPDGDALTEGKTERRLIAIHQQAMAPADFRPTKRRTVKELPAPPTMMNGVSVVFVYTMLGLSDREMADMLNISPIDIESLRNGEAYKELFDGVMNEFINADSDLVQSRIAAYAHSALIRVAEISATSEEESVALRASQDILDRAGHAPKDRNARANSMAGNDLRIVVVDGERTVQVNINANTTGEK
jgi:hypothetical protein